MSQGEGSRGGKIVGHYRSGRAKYASSIGDKFVAGTVRGAAHGAVAGALIAHSSSALHHVKFKLASPETVLLMAAGTALGASVGGVSRVLDDTDLTRGEKYIVKGTTAVSGVGVAAYGVRKLRDRHIIGAALKKQAVWGAQEGFSNLYSFKKYSKAKKVLSFKKSSIGAALVLGGAGLTYSALKGDE